jgi:hypothetical protein
MVNVPPGFTTFPGVGAGLGAGAGAGLGAGAGAGLAQAVSNREIKQVISINEIDILFFIKFSLLPYSFLDN